MERRRGKEGRGRCLEMLLFFRIKLSFWVLNSLFMSSASGVADIFSQCMCHYMCLDLGVDLHRCDGQRDRLHWGQLGDKL